MLQGLIDTKKESIEFLQDTFSVPISERIYEICLQCQKLGLREFQKELCSISKWNNFTIEEETNKIIAKSGCDFLPKMLKIVILSCLKIKFYEYSRKVNTLKIKIPSSSDFLHKCLINVAEFAWKHSYLFAQKNMKAIEIQNNMNEFEHSVRKIIAKTISEYLNVKYVIDKLNHLIEKHVQNKKKVSRTGKESDSETIGKNAYHNDIPIDNDNNNREDDQEDDDQRADDNREYDQENDQEVDKEDDREYEDKIENDNREDDQENDKEDDDERADDYREDDQDDENEREDDNRDNDNERDDDQIFEDHFNKTSMEIEAIEKYDDNGTISDNQEESDEELSEKDDNEKHQELKKEENEISKFKSDSESSEGSRSSESDSDLESEPNPNIKIVKISDLSKRKFF
jgi:hypothetical protein